MRYRTLAAEEVEMFAAKARRVKPVTDGPFLVCVAYETEIGCSEVLAGLSDDDTASLLLVT